MKKFIGIASALLLPVSAFAAGNTLQNLIYSVQDIITSLFPILVGIAVLFFFYEIIMLITKGKDKPEEKAKAITGIIYSLVAIFIMLTFFGLVKILASTVGVQTGDSVTSNDIPTVQFQ
jgi:fumarate reductase subunit D